MKIYKIYLCNLGCKVNYADLSSIKTLLIEKGYEIVDEIIYADVVLVNTCAVTNHAVVKSRSRINKIRKEVPNAFIGVLGCYAQLAAESVIRTTGADFVFGTNEKFRIAEMLPELLLSSSKSVFVSHNIDNAFTVSSSLGTSERVRGFIKLQDGCNNRCSYCIVPLVRGDSRSIKFTEIVTQINILIDSGYKEIVVSGINLSDYRGENGESFIDLVRILANADKYFISSDIRFRISSIEPQAIDKELIDVFGSKYICPHFHIPLQSGSDKILKKMLRKYNTEQFRTSIELINKYLPNAFIGLDVISGFPTESDNNFIETKDFISSLNISALHCFTYSIRKGTLAAYMEQIPYKIKKERTKELLELSKTKQEKYNNNNIGEKLLLLPEKYNIKNKIATGHTENYLEVNIKTDAKLENNFYKVTISEIKEDKILGKIY